jgi:DNA-binding MarR family transcriptional regulator
MRSHKSSRPEHGDDVERVSASASSARVAETPAATSATITAGRNRAKRQPRAIRLESFIPYQMSLLTHRSTLVSSELHADRHRLTVQEWRVLSIIADKGPLVPAEIRRFGTQDKSTISWAIKRLQHRHMVVRQPRAHDGRTFEVSLNEQGWTYYRAVAPVARGKAQALLRQLTSAELAELRRLLAKLERAESERQHNHQRKQIRGSRT